MAIATSSEQAPLPEYTPNFINGLLGSAFDLVSASLGSNYVPTRGSTSSPENGDGGASSIPANKHDHVDGHSTDDEFVSTSENHDSSAVSVANLPSSQSLTAGWKCPRLLSDRFVLNKTLGYFHGLGSFVRLEVPDYITEDRRKRIQGLVSYHSKLKNDQLGDEGVVGAMPMGLGSQMTAGPFSEESGDDSHSSLAVKLLDKFGRTGFRRDLEDALRVAQLALSEPFPDNDDRGVILLVLGILLSCRFKFTKDAKDHHAAIGYLNDALDLSPTSNEWWHHECRVVRAVLLTTYFCETKSDDAFKSAIVSVTQAIQVFDHRCSTMNGYFALSICSATLHGERFYNDPSPLDWIAVLESGIHILQEADSANISDIFGDENYRRQLLGKMNVQLSRFHVLIEDLDKHWFPADCDAGSVFIIDKTAGAVLSAMWEEYSKRMRKVHPAVALAEIFDPKTCISVRYDIRSQDDFGGINENTPDSSLSSFGLTTVRFHFRLLQYRVSRLNPEKQDTLLPQVPPRTIEEAIDHSKMYDRMYQASNDLEHLTQAIHYAEMALEDLAHQDQRRSQILVDLVFLCYSYSCQANTLASLTRVVQYGEFALADVEIAERRRYSIAAILADSSRQAFLLGSSLSDFDKCVDLVRATLDEARSGNHDRLLIPVDLPSKLAMCFKARYQSTGDPSNLDDCIKLMELAIAFPFLDQESVVLMYNNYALVLRLRYRRTKSLEDLNLAFDVLVKALDHLAELVDRLSVLNNLTLVLSDRYNRIGDPNDLHMAITYGEEGLSLADQAGDGIKMGILINLANTLALTGDSANLDKAVNYARQALALDRTLISRHQAPILRSDASEILLQQYRIKNNYEDLQSAIALAEEASKLARTNKSSRGDILLQLAECLSFKNLSTDSWQRVVDVYLDAWKSLSLIPAKRIYAASKAAEILVNEAKASEAAQLLEDAVDLMPNIDSRWTQRSDRQGTTTVCLALPANAAVVALKAGKSAERALELLEAGRGRTLGALLDLRMEAPGSEDPNGLIRSFNLLRMRTDATSSPAEEHRLGETTRKLLRDIRRQPGFERFMYPPTANDYMKVAIEGPIVIVITSEIADPGMAIIVTASRVYSLPLVDLTHADTMSRLREMSEELTRGDLDTFSLRNKKMAALLGWLWDLIAGPVIQSLGLQKLPNGSLPRIRWIGIGLLAMAPLHAAGKYTATGVTESTMNYAISSYAPSLRALLYAAERTPKHYLNRKRDARVLVVKMSETKGAAPLENVAEEAETLKGLALSVSMKTTDLDSPTTAEVLNELPLHNLVHFACHGVSDPEDPSNSHLMLSDGPLTVERILKTHSAEPDVAFLSACSTAESHDARVVDESIHVASAFLMVGFKHAIGTLWQGSDRACMEISNKFYSKLIGEDESQWDGSWKVSSALHHAVKEIQQRYPKYPLIWAPFVVFGP